MKEMDRDIQREADMGVTKIRKRDEERGRGRDRKRKGA